MSILRVGSVGDISPVTHSYNIREITPRKCPIQPVWLGMWIHHLLYGDQRCNVIFLVYVVKAM